MSSQDVDPQEAAGIGVAPGQVFGGRYRVVRLLGAGGMGAVFEARHEAIGKVVALKVLHPSLATDPKFSVRFLQEAKTATEVHHRHIVEILDFGVEGGKPFMVMEYLRGESLAALFTRERRLAPGRIVRILEPVLRALAAAHERGVVHRDLKPDNIFLAREDDAEEPLPKVLDFGIAKRSSADDVRLTDTRASMGTPAYMAPEQAMGARDVTPSADQFALGVILFEALTGRVPHEGETYNAVIIAKVTTPAADLAKLRPDLDPALVAVVMRTLQREPAQRFANVTQLREALAPFRDVMAVRTSVAPPPTTPGDETHADGTPLGRAALAATVAALAPPADAIAAVSVAPSAAPASPAAAPEVWSTDADLALLGARGQPEGAQDKPKQPTAVAVAATADATATAKRGVPIWALGAAAALLLAVAVGAHFANPAAPPGASPAPGTAHAETAAPPRAPEPVTFRVRVEPATAEIVLDGDVVGHGTAEVIRPRDGRRHQLLLRAAGYTEVTEVLVADGDVRVDRSLASTSAPPAGDNATGAHPAGATAGAHRAPPPATGPGPRRPNIDRANPF